MKDLFKLILALPFLGFQAGGSIALGCLGFLFYSFGILLFIFAIIFLGHVVSESFHGNIWAIGYICFLILLALLTNFLTDIYLERKYPTKD